MLIKRIKCYLEAIKTYLKHGVWVPHVYRDTREKAIIVASRDSFRVSDSCWHIPGEQVYLDGCLIRSQCIYCGHKMLSWTRKYTEDEE